MRMDSCISLTVVKTPSENCLRVSNKKDGVVGYNKICTGCLSV